MAYTDPNSYYYAAPTSNLAFVHALVQALCGVHATIPSTTRYTVIESYHSVSAVRQVPSGGLLENSTNGWEPGGATPGTNSWIVLQCEETRSGDLWQVEIRCTGNTELRLYPDGNWVPGGGTVGSPTRPSPVLTSISPGLNLGTPTSPRSLVWDKSMFLVLGYNGGLGTQNFSYVGEFDTWLDLTLDPKPYCLQGSTSSQDNWDRISAQDGTTATTLSTANDGEGASGTDILTYGPTQLLPYLFTVRPPSAHYHAGGVARHCARTIHAEPGGSTHTLSRFGTGDRSWIRAVTAGSGTGHFCVRHDGTVVGTDAEMARLSYDLEPPTGYPLIRRVPWLVRGRP
jgi:hypothetical protein